MRLSLAALVCIALPLQAVNWHNDLDITADVHNQNISVIGTNELKAPIHVVSSSADILVSIDADSIITSSLQLYFFADTGRIITFSVVNDLILRGSQTDFLITFSGDGDLKFWIKGGKQLTFTENTTTRAGALFYVLEGPTGATTPIVTFGRFPLHSFPNPEPNLHAFVNVGANSAIAFAAQTATSTGTATQVGDIFFDATQIVGNTGRLVLNIENGASVLAAGSLITTLADPVLADIDDTIPAGLASRFEIINSGAAQGRWSAPLVVNSNKTWTPLMINPFCEAPTTSIRHGFIIGANGVLTINDQSYLDYVVTVTNISPDPVITMTVLDYPCERFTEQVIKDRNPAALIIDGSTETNITPAMIIMNGDSAAYFRSGVNCEGIVTTTLMPDTPVSFLVNPDQNLRTEGTILFDVEGRLDVRGDPNGENALNILSLEVNPTGGSVFIEGTDTVFPLRTFAKTNGVYDQYGTGCFMINNRMNIFDAALQHTDQNHPVFENNIVAQSSPAYIGGESRSLGCPGAAQENAIAFYNAQFLVHTSAAATGVDFKVPNNDSDNQSNFTFYYNGRCIDQGSGRSLILGTNVGSVAEDQAHIINRDSHLDVMQEVAGSAVDQRLSLLVAPNNTKVTEGIVGTITDQFSIQTIFLGHASNISIGTNGDTGTDPDGNPFVLTTFPEIFINGDYFSFTTQGGALNNPSASMTTGEGGIFVDKNGVFDIASNRRASVATMVTKSRNASIDLPKSKVLFGPRVGLAQWQLNLNDPNQLTIVPLGESLSDFNVDWKNTTKDYCTAPVNVPYELPSTPAAGASPAVTNANLIGLPLIKGSVEQMQFTNARLGDQAQVVVDGGLVREMVFLTGDVSATAPTGFLVLQNDAIVGLGSADRNVDSLDSAVVLGVNGVTLVANGNGTVHLNKNTIINNVCHILTGTAFGINGPQQLLIDSDVPRELRVKSDGVLDLTSFTNTNQQLAIGGQVKVVFEPGAKLLLGAGTFIFTDQGSAELSPFIDGDLPVGTTPSDTDAFRVKWIGGSGPVIFEENSRLLIPRSTILGVETDSILNITTVNVIWQFRDAAQLLVGTPELFGGALQVGNVLNNIGHTIDFGIVVNGISAGVNVDSQGFMGFGVGICDKQQPAPNDWRIDRLFNVNAIGLGLPEGTWRAQQIYPGSDINASLIALAPVAAQYTLSFSRFNAEILGGSNIILTNSALGFFNPVVGTTSGVISGRYSAGILSSKPTLLDSSKTPNALDPRDISGSAATLFDFLSMNDYAAQGYCTATIFQSALGTLTIGYVDGTTINRVPRTTLRSGLAAVGPERALAIGGVGLALNASDRAPAIAVLNP